MDTTGVAMHKLLFTSATPHEKSFELSKYTRRFLWMCWDSQTSCCILPSKCMEENKKTNQLWGCDCHESGRGLCTLYDVTKTRFHHCVLWDLLFLKSGSSKISDFIMGSQLTLGGQWHNKMSKWELKWHSCNYLSLKVLKDVSDSRLCQSRD